MSDLRAAVVGAGRLGSLHAAKYAALEGVRVTHVVDVDADRAAHIASQYGASALADYRALDGQVDVVTVASPGVTHFEIASHLLRAGCDVLLEKPMAANLEDARALTALAERSDRIL
ncbi:MAG TPA: Gfo/Idh/MocA family oxidoreductase, partial [Candidatus Binataceae bacterium]|nr:Gfo/Idh/MocA family oxidoreductase [Candidatus Binataceae bacterium]